ncbi:Transcription factor RF2b [Platanthera guangdongensis]|uniref:Transcription factor RF2b n=1 Tax=Platanthera guangdongensis TaxID=2320717 RepID=A0ABR2MHS9_9ASPA
MDRCSIPPAISNSQPAARHPNLSLCQPAFFSLESPPQFCPSPYQKTSPTSSISAGDGLPPRNIHRRSRSDVLQSGFLSIVPPTVKFEPSCDGAECTAGERKSDGNIGDDLFYSFLNLDGFGVVKSSHQQTRECGDSKNGAYSSESETESCAIDCVGIDESTPAIKHSRHVRSISTGGLIEGQALLRIPPSPGSKRSDPMDGPFCLEFGSGKFSGTELKKIMADKKLEEIALADPKRAKRIMANRQSAARSKERKIVYISELESKVKILQAEATTLSAHLTLLQRDSAGLAAQNKELHIRLQAVEQQARLREATACLRNMSFEHGIYCASVLPKIQCGVSSRPGNFPQNALKTNFSSGCRFFIRARIFSHERVFFPRARSFFATAPIICSGSLFRLGLLADQNTNKLVEIR